MAKEKTVFVCSECGADTPKWAGRCPACGAWNTLNEEILSEAKKTLSVSSVPHAQPKTLEEIFADSELRTTTGISELDRVLGGGVVRGSLILVSGEPGIGKSTVLLQTCMTMPVRRILYVSGEESPRQIKLRADRLGKAPAELFLLSETEISAISDRARELKPDLLIIDSIQTMFREEMNSAPGSVPQVRECTGELMRLAKTLELPTFVVSHVNKEGAIAGPKVMEHMVDAVLYFEGERSGDHRILRSIKNRFGSTNEIGIFEMTAEGLKEVEDPSRLFLSDRPENVPGIASVCVMEGTRPVLAEVQALSAKTAFPSPRRTAVGFDANRLNLLLAVLEKRCNCFFGNTDVYLNVVGGLRIDDPAADLGIAAALVSCAKDFNLPEKTLFLGELGLAGEIRAVGGVEKRIAQAKSLGYQKVFFPARCKIKPVSGIEAVPVYSMQEFLNRL